MEGVGKILRARGRSLGLSDSEIARRLGLSQALYHNYVVDTAEPDLGTLVRICRVLGTSPNEVLLLNEDTAAQTDSEVARARLASAAMALEGDALQFAADLDEAMLAIHRNKARKPGTRPQSSDPAMEQHRPVPPSSLTGSKRKAAKTSR